jgi:ATP-dependent RNA circularization protein (DNA/RNA ligase family)
MSFVRYPHTPHLASLSRTAPRDDKVLEPSEANALLSGEVTVEEKVDGANLGLSCSDLGELVAQNRGTYLSRSTAAPQFRPLWAWLASRKPKLLEVLCEHLIMFGEWCYARHSIAYSRLPDWFLVFDVYDRTTGQFWSAVRRDALAARVGLMCVPRIARGRFRLEGLRALIGDSRIGDTVMEGIIVRRDDGDWQVRRAKLVRPAFVQEIDEHWSRRRLEPNRLAGSSVARGV